MRIAKKITLVMLSFLSVLCFVLGIAACGSNENAEQAIEMYILPQNEQLVDSDFSLPKQIGKDNAVAVEWKSDNTAAIAIQENDKDYTAKVNLQSEVTSVKLTISAGGASKDFTVRVDELSVYTFLDRYTFPQNKKSVSEDFDLDTSFEVQGKKATIKWSIDADKYGENIALSTDGKKVVVSVGEELVEVEITATFTYNGEDAKKTYKFSVAPILEHRQLVNRMYSIADYPLELSGYIVHVYEASEQYKNATFYMIDDDFCSGYYLYQVGFDVSEIDKFVEGAHITFSGTGAKYYNGLWETPGKRAGTVVFDDKDPIDPSEHIYPLDTDLLSGVPSLLWHESTLVSLSGWKVEKMENKPDSITKDTSADLCTLKRGDTEIVIRITKYIQRTDAERAELLALYDTLKVGDFVNVTGLLGNYNGFQIQPILASDITKANAEGTNTDGAKVKAAVDAVAVKVKENFDNLITADKDVTMPVKEGDVTISYKVAGAKEPTVNIDNNTGKFSIKPIAKERNYDIEVTYKIGDYEAYSFFKLRNWKQSAEELVNTVKAAIEEAEFEVTSAGDTALPAVDDLGATITWSIKNAPAWASIKDNATLSITALPAEATTLTLEAAIELDGKKATATITVAIPAASVFVHEGTLEDPYTVNEAIKIANSLDSDAIYSKDGVPVQVAIAGYVTNVGKIYAPKDTEYYMSSVYIADVAGGTTTLQLYTTAYGDAVERPATEPDKSPFAVGDYIVIYGFIKNFKGNTPEVDKATVSDKAVYPTIKTWEKASVKGSHANPYTIAELKGLSIASNNSGTEYYKVDNVVTPVYVKGIVTVAGSVQNYGIKQYYIADTAGDMNNDIQLYSINFGYVKSGAPEVGDTVLIYGYPQKYKGGDVQVSSWKDDQNQYHNALWMEHIPATGGGSSEPSEDQTPAPSASTVTFSFSSITENGTAIKDGDATEFFTGTDVIGADVQSGLISAVVSKVYKGNGQGGGIYANKGGMLKTGTSSANGSIELKFNTNVTKVVIKAIGWNSGTNSISVNGSAAQNLANAVSEGTQEAVAYDFSLSTASKDIAISLSGRCFVFEISVTFEGIS